MVVELFIIQKRNYSEATKLFEIKSITSLRNYNKVLKLTNPFGKNIRRNNVKSIEKFLRENG